MQILVSFAAADGRCAFTGKPEPMEFRVPVPSEVMDDVDLHAFALDEIIRVRKMSPRSIDSCSVVTSKLVDDDEDHDLPPARAMLAAVPDQEQP